MFYQLVGYLPNSACLFSNDSSKNLLRTRHPFELYWKYSHENITSDCTQERPTPDIRIHIRPIIVQIQCPNARISAIVPIATADRDLLMQHAPSKTTLDSVRRI
jgi:hypothetical protein